jgi:threonine/homoserine/homoserine lactone efflux protein
MTTTQVLGFLLAAFLLTATPGPDNLMVLSVGMSRGRRAGMAFGLGCAVGCLSHTVLAVVGVGAVVASSSLALPALQWIGGAYLVWLGIGALKSGGGARVGAAAQGSDRDLFLKGLLANAINPKIVLFFLSFLPQFVDASQGSVELQLGVLGILFAAQAAVAFALLGRFSGAIGTWLNKRPKAGLWLDRLAGLVFVGLGLRLITAR